MTTNVGSTWVARIAAPSDKPHQCGFTLPPFELPYYFLTFLLVNLYFSYTFTYIAEKGFDMLGIFSNIH